MNYAEEMFKFLTKNNREKLDQYINGYYSAADFVREVGGTRQDFYNAAKQIDPDVTEKRSKKRQELLNNIVKQILNVVPHEYLKFDRKALYGVNKAEKEISNTKDKQRIREALRYSDESLGDFQFISIKIMTSWYKHYLVYKDLMENPDKRGTDIARDFNMLINKFYVFKDRINKHPENILQGVSPEQEKVFKRNAEIFDEYDSFDVDITTLSEDHQIDKDILISIINAFEEAKKRIFKKEDK
ncbi:hypothetical protein DWB88_13800 (plasmid) [Staphylococcus warneri]|nr:hypothetical protein DWB88_13800 [Staphylococcus warneri]